MTLGKLLKSLKGYGISQEAFKEGDSCHVRGPGR